MLKHWHFWLQKWQLYFRFRTSPHLHKVCHFVMAEVMEGWNIRAGALREPEKAFGIASSWFHLFWLVFYIATTMHKQATFKQKNRNMITSDFLYCWYELIDPMFSLFTGWKWPPKNRFVIAFFFWKKKSRLERIWNLYFTPSFSFALGLEFLANVCEHFSLLVKYGQTMNLRHPYVLLWLRLF